MPWADLSEGFSGLKQWSDPVIYDQLIAAYRKLISDRELARNLTRLHARVWRALIRGDMEELEDMRETLAGALHPCNDPRPLAEVDSEIMIELLDVVMSATAGAPAASSLSSRLNGARRPIAVNAASGVKGPELAPVAQRVWRLRRLIWSRHVFGLSSADP